jgi:O-antigen/teichoic acid export membrane protein
MMKGIRTALLLATSDRYFTLAVNFVSIVVVSRLLAPEEVGLAIVSGAIASMWFRLREFATTNFIVQHEEITRDDVRATFTVLFCLSAVLSGILFFAAPFVAHGYGQDGLTLLLRVTAIAVFLDVFGAPNLALFRRELNFGKVALVNVTGAALTAGTTIALAWLGFSYMSFAWAQLIATIAAGFLAFSLKPDLWVFFPSVKKWRATTTFGAYNGVNVLLYGIYESLPYLVVGKFISVEAAGLYGRSISICQIPDKIFMGGVVAVALPALSLQVREGADVKASYLVAIEHITAVQWPAYAIICILAHPVVSIVLGAQWLAVVPLVQLIALSYMFAFSAELNYPLLIALGGFRDVLTRGFIVWPISAVIIFVSSFFGVTAVAFSLWITMALNAYVSIYFVQRRLAVQWADIAAALVKSFAATLSAAAGAFSVVAAAGMRFDLPIPLAVLAGAMALIGWSLGLRVTRHPLLREIVGALNSVYRFLLGTHVFGRMLAKRDS